MTPEHGDYVARIEELTRRTQASLSSQPTSAVAGKTPSAATSVAADLQADPAEHGLGAYLLVLQRRYDEAVETMRHAISLSHGDAGVM